MKKYYYLVGCVLLFVISWTVYQFYFIEITDSKYQLIKSTMNDGSETDGKGALFAFDVQEFTDSSKIEDSICYIEFKNEKYFVSLNNKSIYNGYFKRLNRNEIFLKPNLPAEYKSKWRIEDTVLIDRDFNKIRLLGKSSNTFITIKKM